MKKEILCKIERKNVSGFKNYPEKKTIIIKNVPFLKRLKFLILGSMKLEPEEERNIYIYKGDGKLNKKDIEKFAKSIKITPEDC